MLFSDSPRPEALRAIRFLNTTPFWLDDAKRPHARAALEHDISVDLLIVGGGFTGLWTALLAKRSDPERRVALVEAGRIGDGASGRNGGFVSHSLTHGVRNAVSRWPDEAETLTRLGLGNIDGLVRDVEAFGIDCDLRPAGEITVAVQPHHVEEIAETSVISREVGLSARDLNRDEMRALVNSPIYLSGALDPHVWLVNPARLAWGLADAAEQLGVLIFEGTRVNRLHDADERVVASTTTGSITARRVALATNAYTPLLAQMQRYVVPVYDYALVTEPLSEGQWASIGWVGREGLSDAGNQFHYYRPTEDGRILWGGYDAIYHRDRGVDPEFEVDREAFGRIAEHFLQTFPQLEGIRFTHGWGGAIDTCSRFSPFWGTAHAGKTAYALGYTGLGVGSSRFGAAVMLDLLAGQQTERTELEMVRTKPIAFPPEPIRSIAINWTTRSLQSADQHDGRRNLWLRTLDRLGLGFAS